MREIVLDTETTGLDPKSGHRIVEIGCVEIINRIPTGETYHVYVNPERDMPQEAFNVHGLSEEFLRAHPLFKDHADSFLEFIQNDRLVIHNAQFDMRFINAELTWIKRDIIPMERSLDTVQMARKAYPGQQANLDALCRRLGIDNSNRTLHGALLDAQLLAEVYSEMTGGGKLDLSAGESEEKEVYEVMERTFRQPRVFSVPQEEEEAHQSFLSKISDPIWANPN